MIDLVKRFFGKQTRAEAASDQTHDVSLATCALFIEMSLVDGEFTHEERQDILATLKKDYDLSKEYADALMEASQEALKKSVDLWKFARLINQNYSIGEKIQIIERIWQIAFADGKLDKHEDYLVHKLAQLLRLSHNQLIEAKLRVKQGKPSS